MYSVALGSVSEMSLSASRDERARVRECGAGADDRDHGRGGDLADLRDHPAVFWGSAGRRTTRATNPRRRSAATMSTIATQVFGLDGSDDAATSPSTKAATTPNGERRDQRADVEPQAGSERPVAEDEREHGERRASSETASRPARSARARRRSIPRRRLRSISAGCYACSGVLLRRAASLPSLPRGPPSAPRPSPSRRRTTSSRVVCRRSSRMPRRPARSRR